MSTARISTVARCRPLAGIVLACALAGASVAPAQERDWSLGLYGGQYYDTEPAGVVKGRAGFVDHYMLALTASKTVWRAREWPLALEIDGMVGHQWGVATLQEIAVAPVLRWSGFPWNASLPTAFRFGPVGVSYTTDISPLERGVDNQGSRTLNFLMIELAFARPQQRSDEVFIRLHHRCTIYDLLNNYGANGEDFLTLGYRRFF